MFNIFLHFSSRIYLPSNIEFQNTTVLKSRCLCTKSEKVEKYIEKDDDITQQLKQ